MKALVLSCGGSPEPLQYCIDNYECDFIYFLCSKESVEKVFEIKEKCNLKDDSFDYKIVEDYESFEDSFAKSRQIIDVLKKDYDEIHVDFTGGTKPMIAGLVLASIGEECSYSYVGSQNLDGRDKNGLGIVQNGFESMKSQRDPYEVYAVMEFRRGFDFFNKYQFTASRVNFIQASEKLESASQKEISKLLVNIVEVYDVWDKFNNLYDKKPINEAFKNILNKIDKSDNLKSYFNQNYPEFLSQLKNNQKFLNLKVLKSGDIKTSNVKYYLPDLLNNASRRIEEGKYDDAVARLYRSIELIAQVSLCSEGIIDGYSLKSKAEFMINKNDLNSKYNAEANYLVSEWYEYENSNTTFGVGLKKSFELLESLGSEYAGDYLNDEDISKSLSNRNKSILAHGLKPIDKIKAQEIYEQVFQYAKKAFPDIVEYIKMSKFPKFK